MYSQRRQFFAEPFHTPFTHFKRTLSRCLFFRSYPCLHLYLTRSLCLSCIVFARVGGGGQPIWKIDIYIPFCIWISMLKVKSDLYLLKSDLTLYNATRTIHDAPRASDKTRLRHRMKACFVKCTENGFKRKKIERDFQRYRIFVSQKASILYTCEKRHHSRQLL